MDTRDRLKDERSTQVDYWQKIRTGARLQFIQIQILPCYPPCAKTASLSVGGILNRTDLLYVQMKGTFYTFRPYVKCPDSF